MSKEVSIGATLRDVSVARSIRYRLAFASLRKTVLAIKPKSRRELKQRIESYLEVHPLSAFAFSAAGANNEQLVGKLAQYAQ